MREEGIKDECGFTISGNREWKDEAEREGAMLEKSRQGKETEVH